MTNNETIDGIPVEEFKVRVSGTLELEEDIAKMLRLDGRVVFLAVGRSGKAEYDADEEKGIATRKDVIKIDTLLPLAGEAREQAISYMRDPQQNLIMVPSIDSETGEVKLPRVTAPAPEPGPIEQEIAAHDLSGEPVEEPALDGEGVTDGRVVPRIDITGYGPDEAAAAIEAMQRGEVEIVVAESVYSEIAEGTEKVKEALDQMEADETEDDEAWPDPRSFDGDDGPSSKPVRSGPEKGSGPGWAPVPYDELLGVGPAAPAGAATGGGHSVGHVGDYK